MEEGICFVFYILVQSNYSDIGFLPLVICERSPYLLSSSSSFKLCRLFQDSKLITIRDASVYIIYLLLVTLPSINYSLLSVPPASPIV